MLLELVRQLGVLRWAVALAVLLVDMSVVGPFAVEQPKLWSDFCGQLLEQPELYFLHEVVAALAAAGSQVAAVAAPPTGGGEEAGGEGQQPQVLVLGAGLSVHTARADGLHLSDEDERVAGQ